VDPVYAKTDNFLLSSIKKKYKHTDEEERPIISRLTLHASKLILNHPISNQLLTFEAPLPHDLHALLKVLRKYDSI
jgi:23S rRNA-/tRNA-specific pseudouridylate synthase